MQHADRRLQKGRKRQALVALPTLLNSAVCILHSAFAVPAQSQESCTDFIPLRPGVTWNYQGTVLWTRAGASTPDSAAIRWTMTVERVREAPDVHLSLIRGLVTQLAWYEPGRTPRLALLVCSGSRLWALEFESDSTALDAFEHWKSEQLSQGELWLELPLRDGALLGQDPPRQDSLYGWLLRRLESAPAPPAGCPSGMGPRFVAEYRSLPDHRMIEWQPGVGITAFTYGHHGTPAGAEVVLAGCKPTAG